MPSGERRPLGGQEERYDQFVLNSFPWITLERPAFDRHVASLITPSMRALDAGCGSGRIVGYLLDKGADPTKIVGVDIDARFVSIAEGKFPGSRFFEADISQPLNLENKFDLVTCHQVLNILTPEQMIATFNNFYSVLDHGGVLFYIVPHPIRMAANDLGQYFHRAPRLDLTPWGTHIPYWQKTVSDYLNSTIDAGFVIRAVDEPEVSPQSRLIDPAMYKRHTTYPSRLVVKATKV